MADISSINLNGNSYNIKDNNAVSKSGGTITGTLQVKSSVIDSSSTNPPSSNQYFVGLGMYDKNDKYIGYLQAARNTNGNNFLQIGARRIVNSANKDASLVLYLDAAGNPTCTLPKITSGTWEGSTIDIAHGGTGQTTTTGIQNALDVVIKNKNSQDITSKLRLVNKTYDINGVDAQLQFIPYYTTTELSWAYISLRDQNRLQIAEVANNTSKNYELYRFPVPDTSITGNKFYDVLTSKNAVTVSQGGTGKTTHTTNAILTGDGTNAVKNVATKSGAFYATTANGAASFGTLPVAQGGTGVATFTSGAALIGSGTNNITTRSITNNTSKNYITANTNLITANTLGYWNGAYNNSGSSNINYLGTISKGTWQGDAIELNYGGTGGTDSGWKSVTNSSAFSGTIYYRKIGHFGEIYAYNIKLANPVSDSSQHILATIDSAYAPDKGFSMNVGSRYIIAQVLIGSDGEISIYKNTSSQNITTSHTFHLNFTYFI